MPFGIRALGLLLALIAAAPSQETYYRVALDTLELTEGELPRDPGGRLRWRWRSSAQEVPAWVVLDGPGEAYLVEPNWDRDWPGAGSLDPDLLLSVRAPVGEAVSGILVFPQGADRPMGRIAFRLPPSQARTGSAAEFQADAAAHYERLARRGVAGTAWFRHRMAGARPREDPGRRRERRDEPEDVAGTIELFAGGRAIAENLQLSRTLPDGGRDRGGEVVPMDSLPGITVREIDWAPHLADVDEVPDPLAASVPSDQYAIFFARFAALERLLDLADSGATPILSQLEARAEDAMTRARYEQQLGVRLDPLVEAVAARLVRSAVLTGSDPSLRLGSDVALVLESAEPEALLAAVARHRRVTVAASGIPGAVRHEEELGGVRAVVWRSADRRVCSYLARVGDAVVLTNSPVQMRRVAEAASGERTSLDELDEYRFFRQRYRRGDPEEAALVVVTDAAIRRWCSPQWRIGASRRIRALSELSELQATQVDALMAGVAKERPLRAGSLPEELGSVTLDASGVRSSVFNTLQFLTPVAELKLTHATVEEARLYTLWRDGYQANWSRYFDPIGIRISADERRVGVDVTVMPLIVSSEYREWVDVAQGSVIEAAAGDRHPGTLLHFALAIDKNSRQMRSLERAFSKIAANTPVSALSWLGSSISVYVDPDPFFQDLATSELHPKDFLWKNLYRLPVALHCEVTSSMKLALFLTGLRAWVHETAPELTRWTVREHAGQAYMSIGASDENGLFDDIDHLGLFYAAMPEGLVLSLNERMVQRAIERIQSKRAARVQGTTTSDTVPPWLGQHVALQLDLRAAEQVLGVLGDGFGHTESLRQRSWSNLPILAEWKRAFPDRDPIAVHEQLFGTRLRCPSGGFYVWNARWQTFESSVFGHPGAPRDPERELRPFEGWARANFGLTFENEGLRARCELLRDP